MSKTVFVIEAVPLIGVAISDHLHDEGYDVIEAGSVADSLAKIGEQAGVRVVLIDAEIAGPVDGLMIE